MNKKDEHTILYPYAEIRQERKDILEQMLGVLTVEAQSLQNQIDKIVLELRVLQNLELLENVENGKVKLTREQQN